MPKSKTKLLIKVIYLATAICIPGLVTFADGLPDLTLPDGVGVNIHFTTGHERDLDLIQAGGFKWVRMDLGWDRMERQKGSYDWSDFDKFTTELDKHGLRAYYILDYSNPLYESAVDGENPITHKPERHVIPAPQHAESIAAYARWAAATAEHFRGRGVVWEIWNEPNGTFWEPKADAAQYTAMALAVAKAIRAADPHACIVAPASAGFPWDFLDTVLKSGVLDYIDAVSVHPYRGNSPETAARDYARLREMIKHYAPAGKDIPILSGEWGYSTRTKGVSEETQAAYIARQQLSNLYNGVPISIWYDWKNDGNDPNENEHNFGTVRSDLQPKPAYLAIQKLTHELAGYRIAGRQDTGNTNDWVLTLTNNAGATKLAAWTRHEPHSVALGSKVELQLDAAPRYVSAGK